MKPTHRAKPTDDRSGIGSPSAALPNAFELIVVATARIAIASPSIVRWAASFSRAIRRLPNGAAATRSRLPRRASPASVDDSARIDQSAVPRANDGTVLPAHVAAQRAELLGLAEQVDHRRRDAPDELVDLEAGRRRREHARDGGAHDERHPAEEAGGDDEREPRIADRLAVDAPEAVQPAGGAGSVGTSPRRVAAITALPAMVGRRLDGLLAVLGEERLLEVRLAADEVEQLVPGGRPDDRA